ncbi:MAG TPA: hypothetical protein VF331_22110 [Polyangiales bacterium]
MLIRSTPYACFVMLRNGLTLEIFYDEALTGQEKALASNHDDLPRPSQGAWLMGESVLFEVRAGQA